MFSLLSFIAFSAPFGLKMGMTIKEIYEQCDDFPSFVKDDIYLIKPKKSHPLFDYYAVYVNDKTGLYQIKAISASISTNQYGTELQNAFNNVKDRIAKTYGTPKIIDTIASDVSAFDRKDKYWFMTLKDGARELYALWDDNSTLTDNLEIIVLDCVADSGYLSGESHLMLRYFFRNAKDVQDEQDDVF